MESAIRSFARKLLEFFAADTESAVADMIITALFASVVAAVSTC